MLINIIRIEWLKLFRGRKELFMFMVFPMIMMTILTWAFSGSFSTIENIPQMNIEYHVANTQSAQVQPFTDFLKSVSKELPIHYKKISNIDSSKKKVQQGEIDALVVLNNQEKITLYTNQLHTQQGDLVQFLIDSYKDSLTTYQVMMENKPSQSVNLAQSHKGKFIQKHSLNLKNSPTSADYYSVAMFTLMGLYGLTTCISLYFYDKQNHILQRQLITPLGKKCMIFYKFVSYFSLLLLQSVLLYLFAIGVLKANWGVNQWWILGLSLTFSMFIVSLALLLCVWVRNQRMISSVLTVVIPIAAFLGGSYVPLSVFQLSLLDKLSMFSPIHWMNKAMFQLIFDIPNSQVYQVLFLNVTLCILCLVISTIMIKKRGIV